MGGNFITASIHSYQNSEKEKKREVEYMVLSTFVCFFSADLYNNSFLEVRQIPNKKQALGIISPSTSPGHVNN